MQSLQKTVATLEHQRFQDSVFSMTSIYLSEENASQHRDNWKNVSLAELD
jgi:hypothetical protein